MAPLVTVIMPAYNAARFIGQAIDSVLEQGHNELQLIVVNDGSTDDTSRVVHRINDPRVEVIDVENGGVSRARNHGLTHAQGEFICFLDADDHMPPGAIHARLAGFTSPEVHFVDGAVVYCDGDLRPTGRRYEPAFNGDPFPLLLAFDPRCFFGNTWMIRRSAIGSVRFMDGLTHCEDLLFYLELARGGQYTGVRATVLHYRVTGASSMIALDGLHRGYRTVLHWMRKEKTRVSAEQVARAKAKVRRMMTGAYLRAGSIGKAFGTWISG